jgi:hypothetical protein
MTQPVRLMFLSVSDRDIIQVYLTTHMNPHPLCLLVSHSHMYTGVPVNTM